MITLQTNYGPIKIRLDTINTPKTAENFLNYAKSGYYDGTLFHRVIKGFMIQGGGFASGMVHKTPGDSIQNEANQAMPNKIGTVAMARTSDPHSATAQFFINVADNHFLDFKAAEGDGWGYCVFGEVVDGMDVVNKISKVETTTRVGHGDVPIDDVVIQSVTVEEDGAGN